MEVLFKDACTLTNDEISVWEKEFDSDRVNAVNRKRENDRILSICGDLLVFNAFKSRYPHKEFRIKHNDKGKPYLCGDEFYFSISHKGTKAVCLIWDKPVGIDIEDIKPFNKRTAERICTQNELQYVGDSEQRFAEVWTVKEAYSKLKGNGISMGLGNIIIDINQKTVCGLPFFTEILEGYVYSWVVSDENNG